LIVGFREHRERRVEEVRLARDRVSGTQIPRLAGQTRVDDAEIAEVADLARTLLLVALVAFEAPEVVRDGVETRGVETLGRARGDARGRREEADRGPRPARELPREGIVDRAKADH